MWWLLIPMAAFAAAFGGGAIALLYLVKRMKFSRELTASGEVVQIDSPIERLNVHPESKLDPRLAEIPVYPGAISMQPATAEVVAELRLGSMVGRDISTTHWTPDSPKQVWEFYRHALPAWPRNLSNARGRELISHEPDCVRLIRITTESQRTIIETSIKPQKYPNVFG